MSYLGKCLVGAGIGVLAVAAVPFTGGGSLLAGASIASSLAGAGTIAAAVGAGAVGAAVGAAAEGVEQDEEMERIKRAKASSFEDGIKKGRTETIKTVKERDDFILALTALVYYMAQCDGYISEEEQNEITFDLDALVKNQDLPAELLQEINKIKHANLTFEDVKCYLDNVSLKNLYVLLQDSHEIIEADNLITEEEKEALNQLQDYIALRYAHNNE